jgi:hypothetical protein
MRVKLIQDTASLYPQPDLNSSPVHRLNRGDVGEMGNPRRIAGREWAELTLPDGTRGFIPERTRLLPLIQATVTKKTILYETPDNTIVKMELPKRAVVNYLDMLEQGGRRWLFVQDAVGNQGYIESSASLTSRTPVSKKTSLTNMLIGGALFVFGVIMTLITHSATLSGLSSYLVLGAILFGLVQFVSGLIQFLNAKE